MRYLIAAILVVAALAVVGCQQQAAPPAPPTPVATMPAAPAQPAMAVVTPQPTALTETAVETKPASDSAKAALRIFINCLRKSDGKTLYDMFPPDARTSADQFYTKNKSSFPNSVKNSSELFSYLLQIAKAGIPEEGEGYGLSAFMADIIDENFSELPAKGTMQGETATFITSEGEKIVFTKQADNWILESGFADSLFERMVTIADI